MLCQKEQSVVFYLKSKGSILFTWKIPGRFWGVPWMRTLPHLHSRNTSAQSNLGEYSRHFCVSAQTLRKLFLLLVSRVFNSWHPACEELPRLLFPSDCSREHQRSRSAERSRVSQRWRCKLFTQIMKIALLTGITPSSTDLMPFKSV